MNRIDRLVEIIKRLEKGQEFEFETTSKSKEVAKYMIELGISGYNVHKTYIYKKNAFHSFVLDIDENLLREIIKDNVFLRGVKYTEKTTKKASKKKVKKNATVKNNICKQ
jgi:hypothetical protein